MRLVYRLCRILRCCLNAIDSSSHKRVQDPGANALRCVPVVVRIQGQDRQSNCDDHESLFRRAFQLSRFIPYGLGWIPDLPDPRDFTCKHAAVETLFSKLPKVSAARLVRRVDLRCDADGDYFMSVEDQGTLNSSTVFAVLSLVEYFERRACGSTFEGSKRFLNKVARNTWGKVGAVRGDTGLDLRTAFKTLCSFGVPSQEMWPYDVERFDEEPTQFVYSASRSPEGIRYVRLDERNAGGLETWEIVISLLTAGFPVAFGVIIPTSLTASAIIPYRPQLDRIRGGQALVAVGFELNRFGRGKHALLVRSSWGRQWGDNGNGWLPADYVCSQLARDFWTVISERWLDACELACPSVF